MLEGKKGQECLVMIDRYRGTSDSSYSVKNPYFLLIIVELYLPFCYFTVTGVVLIIRNIIDYYLIIIDVNPRFKVGFIQLRN